MARYGQAFKNIVIAKLAPPFTTSLEEVSREVGVSLDTRERWRAESLTKPARERAWSAAARLSAVITTAAMDESSRSAWRRKDKARAETAALLVLSKKLEAIFHKGEGE